MNVVLLQIELDASSPARNLQRVLEAIEHAAQADPPPDLLVLPGACDTGGPPPGGGFPLAVIQNVREAIAYKAREWGIYIAVGLHVKGPDGYGHAAVLFDPDADAVAVHQAGGEHAGGGDEHTDARWCSTVGDVAVRAVEGEAEVSLLAPAPARGLLVAAPLPADAEVKVKANGAHWAIVRSAGSGSRRVKARPTRFVNPKGKAGPSANSAKEEAVVKSVLAIRPATPEERAEQGLAAQGTD